MSGNESYKIKTTTFEGPLDLLLHLIESRKMHISDVSLSEITDDYIQYLERLEKYSLKISADFILTATILMLIKSKSLLPELNLKEEEEQSISDLENRLKEYKKIKELSKNVENIFGEKIIFFKQQRQTIREKKFSPDENIKQERLLILIKNVIENAPRLKRKPKLEIGKNISLEEVIEDLAQRLKEALKMSFKNYSGVTQNTNLNKEEKIKVVVSFLAMLELVKQGVINTKQEERFGEITMNTQELDIPNYI